MKPKMTVFIVDYETEWIDRTDRGIYVVKARSELVATGKISEDLWSRHGRDRFIFKASIRNVRWVFMTSSQDGMTDAPWVTGPLFTMRVTIGNMVEIPLQLFDAFRQLSDRTRQGMIRLIE